VRLLLRMAGPPASMDFVVHNHEIFIDYNMSDSYLFDRGDFNLNLSSIDVTQILCVYTVRGGHHWFIFFLLAIPFLFWCDCVIINKLDALSYSCSAFEFSDWIHSFLNFCYLTSHFRMPLWPSE
jgi:hypothetical protein